MWEQEEQEALLVNSVLMVKATTVLQSNVLLTDLSKQACDHSVSKDATDLYRHRYSFVALCVFVHAHVITQEHHET